MPSNPTGRSSSLAEEAYVWIWLPGAVEPIVAGRLEARGDMISFVYGQSYLSRPEAISIFNKELPLQTGLIVPQPGLSIAGCIRDGAPDAWGRRSIHNRIYGRKSLLAADPLGELTYLLESGSDRIGALDFQTSPSSYVPRSATNATLEELLDAAQKLEAGIPLTPELDEALEHGTSIGEARPKALIESRDDPGLQLGETTRKYIAKFSSSSDTSNVIKGCFRERLESGL